MDNSFLMVIGVAFAAALASPVGGLIAIFTRPSSLILSLAVGLAGGVLLGTFAFEMMPKALERASLIEVGIGFASGFVLVYGLDMFVNRGAIAGPEASQKEQVERYHRRRKPRGSEVSVLAGGTSAEELIEGLAIGIGAAINPGSAIIVAAAICIDNVSEAMSIGELAREEDKQHFRRRILKWTGLIGLSLFSSALIGWFFLRDIPDNMQGFLFAIGAGGMFYLTVTDLLPEAESHQYQQSSAIAAASGFLLIMVLSQLI